MTVTCDSNDHEESTWTPRILIEEERGIGIELREMSKDWIWNNIVEEPTISKDDLEGFRCKALLVDHSDRRSVFKAEQVAKVSNGRRIFISIKELKVVNKKFSMINDNTSSNVDDNDGILRNLMIFP